MVKTLFSFGLLAIFIFAPFQSPDEFNHFFRAWQIADNQWIAEQIQGNDGVRVGGYVPQALVNLMTPYRRLPFHSEANINNDTIANSLKIYEKNAPTLVFADFVNTAVYAPTAYFPQSIAIAIGKSLSLPLLVTFYLARFAAFLFWLFMIRAALDVLKDLKEQQFLLFLLAFLPTSLLLNTTTSADVVTNGCTFYLIAIFIRKLLLSENLSGREMQLIVLLSVIISVNKIAYFPLLLCFTLFPTSIFEHGKKSKVKFLFSLFAINILFIIIWLSILYKNGLLVRYEQYDSIARIGQQLNENVNPTQQLFFILQHPIRFTQILLYSLVKSLPHTLIHYVGKFGWEKNYLPYPILAHLMIMLLIQSGRAKITGEKAIFNARLVTLFALLTCLSFIVIMYMIWSPVGADFIENLGGKYFIPIFPLFFLFLPTFFQKSNLFSEIEKHSSRKTTYYLFLAMNIMAFLQVLERYYF
jgi:uncharacterized membrane protein